MAYTPIENREGIQPIAVASAAPNHPLGTIVRGYDPLYDVTAFTEELWSRRANVAAPTHSLMLLKSSGAVPHEGGQVTVPGELYYETIKAWIASQARK